MDIKISTTNPASYRGPLITVGVFKPHRALSPHLRQLDEVSGGLVRELLAMGDFRADWREIRVQHTLGRMPARRLMLVGLGERERWNLDRWRGCVAEAARACRDLVVNKWALAIDPNLATDVGEDEVVGAAVEAALLGLYRFESYKKRDESWKPDPKELRILVSSTGSARRARRVLREASITTKAVCWVRDLVSQPPNSLNPSTLSDLALEMARDNGLRVQVLNKEDLETLGMGGVLAVGSASVHQPKVVVVEHVPENPRGKVAMVGKGITFDSGGVNLKPPDRMNLMKYDMSGAATVLGVLNAAGRLELPLHLVGIIPLAENLPGGRAYRPGDILRMSNGVTVEVTNTDAEGRLLLADCLAYAQRYQPDVMVDVATLTGACVVALGDQVAGIMGNDEGLLKALQEAGKRTAELVWPLPLLEEYEDHLKSTVADIKNAGGREAGAIQGGLFLSRFVGQTPWVHMDVAGPVWTEKDLPYRPKGATGFGVRLLLEFLRGLRPREEKRSERRHKRY